MDIGTLGTRVAAEEQSGLSGAEPGAVSPAVSLGSARSPQLCVPAAPAQDMFTSPWCHQHPPFSPQMCKKREKRLPDPTLEKYVLTVVLDTINAFFSSPFSENSTSLQVRRRCVAGGGQRLVEPQNKVWTQLALTQTHPPSPLDPPDHRGAASPVHHAAAGVSVAAAAAPQRGGSLHPHAGHGR